MFGVDDKELVAMEKALGQLNKVGIPIATRRTLNDTAKEARPLTQEAARQNMILRNKYTERSIRFRTTKERDIDRMETAIGSTEDYMERQEFGGTVRKRGKHGHPIPTTVASNEGRGVRPRRRPVTKSKRMSNINLGRKGRPNPKGMSPRQRAFVMLQMAKRAKQKFAFLNFPNSPGIFRIFGTKKKPKAEMVHSLKHKSVKTKRNPTISVGHERASLLIPGLWAANMAFQFKRLQQVVK